MPVSGYYHSGYFTLALVQTTGGTFWDALRTYLKGVASLAPITEVYLRRPSVNPLPALPYLIVSPIGDDPFLNTGPDYEVDVEVQGTLVASDDVTATTLGQAVVDALMPSANNPALVWSDGAETIRLPGSFGRLTLQPWRGSTDQNVWSYQFGFKWLTVRNR